jgi:hypothetical protein
VVYDGDGNRVSETVAGVTTNYLVGTENPTGYAQVVDELLDGTVARSYSHGLERISETQTQNATLTTSFYGYEGHGSVRQLTSSLLPIPGLIRCQQRHRLTCSFVVECLEPLNELGVGLYSEL